MRRAGFGIRGSNHRRIIQRKPTRPERVEEDGIDTTFKEVMIGEIFLFTEGVRTPNNAEAFRKTGQYSYMDGKVSYPIENNRKKVRTNKQES